MIGVSVSPRAMRAALPVVTIVAAVVTGVLAGVELSLLVVAAGALAGVIALLWASVQALTGQSPLTLDEALTLGAPSAEEEQKRAVLRALKDLEFERSVGKISEEDYTELSTRYREDAKRLIQLIDAGSEAERERAEKALSQRLAATPAKVPTQPAATEHQESDADEPEAEAEPSSPAAATPSEREEEAS
jgi:hypothetical protein